MTESGFVPKVGVYALHRMFPNDKGTPVLISHTYESGRFGVDYVGNEGQGGGSSSAWNPEQFSPITDPETLCLVKAHAAKLDATRLSHEAKRKEEEARTWLLARQAIKEAAAILALKDGPQEGGA